MYFPGIHSLHSTDPQRNPVAVDVAEPQFHQKWEMCKQNILSEWGFCAGGEPGLSQDDLFKIY